MGEEDKLAFAPESTIDKENTQKAIISEFKSLYTSLESRMKVFQTTQSNFLAKLKPELKSALPELSEEELKLTVAYYGISLTDEVLKNYEPIAFAQDINYLLSLIPNGAQDEILPYSHKSVSHTTSSTEVSESGTSRISNSIDENFSDGKQGFQPRNEKNGTNNETEPLYLEGNLKRQSQRTEQLDIEDGLEADLKESLESDAVKQPIEQLNLEDDAVKQPTEQLDLEDDAVKQLQLKERYKHLLNLCISYYQSNSIIEKMINQLNNDIIQLNINKLHPIALTSILIRKHLLSAFDRSNAIFSNKSFQIDLRFIAAQIITAIELTLSQNNRLGSRFSLFQKIKSQYPLGHGDVLHWDISETIIFASYYHKLKKKLQKQIDDGIIAKDLALETAMAQLAYKPPEQNSDESLQQKIDSLIFATMQFNRPFTHSKKQEFSRVVESLLKRRALNEYGNQDILDKSKYTEYFVNDFFSIMKEYPQFLLPLIDIRYYKDFINDPLGHLVRNKSYIMMQFWYQMSRNGYKGKNRSNPYDIGVAFGNFMYFLLTNKRVLDLEF